MLPPILEILFPYEWTKVATDGTSEMFLDDAPRWRDILIQEGDPYAASTIEFRVLQGPIHRVADWWFTTYCGLVHKSGDDLSKFLSTCFVRPGNSSDASTTWLASGLSGKKI